jgi:hypothetical protein
MARTMASEGQLHVDAGKHVGGFDSASAVRGRDEPISHACSPSRESHLTPKVAVSHPDSVSTTWPHGLC